MSRVAYIVKADMTPEQVAAVIAEDGLDTKSAGIITAGSVQVDEHTKWIGVDPVEGWINLRAPEPKPGDTPGQWLHFGEMSANTSNLIAVVVSQ